MALWQRNLRLFIAYRLGASLLVYIAISLPFYQSLGFTLGQIGWLYAITGMTIFLFDIPTGFLADRIGYRRMMIGGVVIQAATFGLLSVTYAQWPIYALQVMLGFGQAVARGADGPLARKSAQEINKAFSPYARWGVAAMGLGEAVASLGTVVLVLQVGVSAPRWAMAIQGLVYLGVALVPWRMHENKMPLITFRVGSLRNVVIEQLRTMAWTVKDELRSNEQARWLLCYGATIGCTTQTVVPLVQPFFQEAKLDVWQFAIVWAGYHVLWAVFSLVSGSYEKRIGRWGALASLVVWGVATNMTIALTGGVVGLVIMVAFYFIRGIQMPIILDYMTLIVPEKRRATLLGVQSTLQFGMFSVMSIVLGTVTERLGVQAAFVVSAVVYGILGTTSIALLRAAR